VRGGFPLVLVLVVVLDPAWWRDGVMEWWSGGVME